MAKKPAKPPAKSTAALEHSAIPWLLAVAVATAAPHAGHLPLWLTLLVSSALIWRSWLWHQNARLPARWLLTLLVVASVAGIGWQFRTLFGKDAGVALLVLFMALKPMEMKTRRDSMVVVMLGFFLLLTHYFYSQSIPTGLWLLCAATLLTATLLRLYGGAQPISAIVRYAGLLLAQAIPFMLIAFLLFPRVSGPLWGLPQDAYSGLTGLSDRMSPGSLNNLIQSGAIAFRVQFSGAPPEKSRLYWRGPVFDDYDGQTWRARAPDPRRPGQPPVVEGKGKTVSYVTTLEPHNQRWLLALDLPLSLPEDSALFPTLETLAKEPIRSRARFAFTSSIDFIANRQETPAVLQQAMRLPPRLNPRSRELAESWREKLESPEQISNAVLRLFQQEAFFYTVRPPLLGQHAADDFLFSTRRGFCEHYASAYVFLMRAAGVPARVVTGYQGGEINPVDGYLTVRQSDAHAWAEIWLAEKGWVRVDPTAAVAPSRIERGIEAALPAGDPLPALIRIDSDWLRDLRNRWEAANNTWNQWVLGYNPQRQREVLSRLGFGEPDWRKMTAALATLCGIALLIVTLWTLHQRSRTPPALRAWQCFCNRLKRFGIIRADWEGPLDFASRVARERPELGALTREAAGHFADLHYGSGDAEQLQELKSCTRHLTQLRPQPLPSSWRKRN
ncbi:transglutaminase TgpA family protein [Propionivibrio sp.]|uniref:transglutaminase TgpA family protein n=1 Tax=Propionivibrio sp. TaxID=2212460 RepID=UPI003BEFC828